jgi:hypothetical protein
VTQFPPSSIIALHNVVSCLTPSTCLTVLEPPKFALVVLLCRCRVFTLEPCRFTSSMFGCSCPPFCCRPGTALLLTFVGIAAAGFPSEINKRTAW